MIKLSSPVMSKFSLHFNLLFTICTFSRRKGTEDGIYCFNIMFHVGQFASYYMLH